MLKASDFFDLAGSPFYDLFEGTGYVWEALKNLNSYIGDCLRPNIAAVRRGGHLITETVILYKGEVYRSGFEIDQSGKKPRAVKSGDVLEGASIIYAGAYLMDDQIFIGEKAVIEPSALIKGPAFIGDGTEVRHGAYIRGDVLIGDDCVVGHTTEMKSSVMLGGSKAGHFAYIGDSILGRVNLGAGTKLANLKMIDSPVTLQIKGQVYETGLRKFGAILGDDVETGCNSVTSPGTLMGKGAMLYPNGTARGYYPPGTIVKVKQNQRLLDLDRKGR